MRLRSAAACCMAGLVLTVMATPAFGDRIGQREKRATGGKSIGAQQQDTSAGACSGVSVSSPSVAVSAETRRSLGLHAWPDTALGVLPGPRNAYRFVAVNVPTLQPPQLVTVSWGSLNNPVAGNQNLGKFGQRIPGNPIKNKPAEYKYAGAGPLYKDPGSGLILQVLHMERNWINPITGQDDKYHVVLDLGVFDPATNTTTRLGPIVQPDISFETARERNFSVDIGTSTITRIGDYFYVYFPDLRADADGTFTATALSVARAPVKSVLSQARLGRVGLWHKYQDGAWAQPALGGASSDIQFGAPMAEHPNVARSTTLGASVMVTSLGMRQMEMSMSANGITGWSKRHPLFRDSKHMNVYPTVVGADGDPSDPGKRFFLYYTQFGETWDWKTARLMRRTIECTAGEAPGTVKLVRYASGPRHMVTSGSAPGEYHAEGHWYISSVQQPGTEALYGCRNGTVDYFVAKDPNCEGKSNDILRTEGWIYTKPPAGPSTPLYRCHIPGLGDHFVSISPDCEAKPGGATITQEGLLGYALTTPPDESVTTSRTGFSKGRSGTKP